MLKNITQLCNVQGLAKNHLSRGLAVTLKNFKQVEFNKLLHYFSLSGTILSSGRLY